MKHFAVLAGTIGAAALVLNADAAPEPARMTVELRDGTVISGDLQPGTLTIRAPYGDISIKSSEILRMESQLDLDRHVIHGKVEGERTDFVNDVPDSVAKNLQRATMTVNAYSAGGPERQRASPWLYPLKDNYMELPRIFSRDGKKFYPIYGTWRRILGSGTHYCDANGAAMDKNMIEKMPHYETKVDFYIVPVGNPCVSTPVAAHAGCAVTLDLFDGSRLNGSLEIAAIAVHTSCGRLNLPAHYIKNAVLMDKTVGGETWQEAKITMRNGDIIVGRPAFKHLKLKTKFAVVEARAEVITKLEVNPPIQLEELKKAIGGNILKWNPDTLAISIQYDFNDQKQLADWPGGVLDDNCRLRATKTKVESKARFSAIKSVDYEGCDISGGGRVTLAFGNCTVEMAGAGTGDKPGPWHLVYQAGDWQHPVIKADAAKFKSAEPHKGRAEIADGKIRWTVNGQVLGALALQKDLVYPTEVRFGMEWNDTSYDNIVITGVLDGDWLRTALSAMN